jgi:hemoglobin-like flavoprotein
MAFSCTRSMGLCHAGLKQVRPSDDIDEKLKVARAIPSWCIENAKIDGNTLKYVKESWEAVLEGKGKPYKDLPDKDIKPPVVFFHDTFYSNLFEIAPEVKVLFTSGVKRQGRVLANILSNIVRLASEDVDKLVTCLRHITVIHNNMEIAASYYGDVGRVLVMTFEQCLGSELFTKEVKKAWIIVFSVMMDVMIPVVVSQKKEHSAKDNTYYVDYQKAKMVKIYESKENV